jgi:lipopolysaccharide/colanic/teichoic acid biosynthesis glycosyltransferase
MVSKESDASFDAAVASGSEISLTGESPVFGPLVDAARLYTVPAGAYLRWIKPALDRFVGFVALIVCLPLMALIGATIWVAMDSPVLLPQDRVGRQGKIFRLWKFRTMAPDRRVHRLDWVGENRRLTHKSPHDPRITPLGRWLRATRLDELPQFFNVVTGDLSLVGPRPELVSVVAQYDAWQHRRHAVKPGITGLWQISDVGDKLLHECTEMELAYLDEVSLKTDLRIIALTIPAMVRRRGI